MRAKRPGRPICFVKQSWPIKCRTLSPFASIFTTSRISPRGTVRPLIGLIDRLNEVGAEDELRVIAKQLTRLVYRAQPLQ
jgi:hypothetical protein